MIKVKDGKNVLTFHTIVYQGSLAFQKYTAGKETL